MKNFVIATLILATSNVFGASNDLKCSDKLVIELFKSSRNEGYAQQSVARSDKEKRKTSEIEKLLTETCPTQDTRACLNKFPMLEGFKNSSFTLGTVLAKFENDPEKLDQAKKLDTKLFELAKDIQVKYTEDCITSPASSSNEVNYTDQQNSDYNPDVSSYGSGKLTKWVCSVGLWRGEGYSESEARSQVMNSCVISTQGKAGSSCTLTVGGAICRKQ